MLFFSFLQEDKSLNQKTLIDGSLMDLAAMNQMKICVSCVVARPWASSLKTSCLVSQFSFETPGIQCVIFQQRRCCHVSSCWWSWVATCWATCCNISLGKCWHPEAGCNICTFMIPIPCQEWWVPERMFAASLPRVCCFYLHVCWWNPNWLFHGSSIPMLNLCCLDTVPFM